MSLRLAAGIRVLESLKLLPDFRCCCRRARALLPAHPLTASALYTAPTHYLLSCCPSFAGVPTPTYLHTNAAELAVKLGLDCPPLSPALWLERYILQLELPQVRGLGAVRGPGAVLAGLWAVCCRLGGVELWRQSRAGWEACLA